ncbi:MAG: T9SS type A sorting domain-containing protein [Candidatus Marinimicrobia bacterium]|nr:T9SS type A sorting domain-containing protein [Candidatus Neomarinimicrobiota bacterium]
MRTKSFILMFPLLIVSLHGQGWLQNDNIFNPSGIPSLPFSQPRFADLDGDNDQDMILGNINGKPLYFENTGTSSSPKFTPGADLFANVRELDCEVGVCVDLDLDGDLDFVSGGFTGLQLYDNIGSANSAQFVRVDDYFSNLNVGENPVPHFADMDADEDLDLVVGLSESGVVRYYENFGSASAASFQSGDGQAWFDVGLYAYPWFSDLDADGDIDLLVGRDGYNFLFYRNDGNAVNWSWNQLDNQFAGLGTTTYWNSPCLVDLTGDGKMDLVHGTASGPLRYYRNSGTLASAVWTEVTSLFGGVLDVGGASNPFFIDFDSDGDLDMLSGSQLGDIKYFENSGNKYGPAWTAYHSIFSSIDHSIYSSVTAGDLDADGLIDLLVGDLSGNLFYHHNTGSGFPYDASMFDGIGVSGWSSPYLMDMDDDLDLDLIIGGEDGGISYYENIGSVESASWNKNETLFFGIDAGSDVSLTFGYVDQNGSLDMITGDAFHSLHFFSLENGLWVEHPENITGLEVGQNATPALADLNGDGDLDLTVGNYDGTFNYFENQSVVKVEEPEYRPQRACLYPAFPNPFNPATTLHFELSEMSHISLKIYDLSGTLIQTLAQGMYQAGVYSANWNGHSLNGNQVSSSVYLAVLESGLRRQVTKLMFIK